MTAEDTFYYAFLSKIGVEEWVDIPGYEQKYQVSNLGRVKTKDYEVECHWGRGFRQIKKFYSHILKPTMGRLHRRYTVKLSNSEQVRRTFAVEQLVALAFIGPRPEGWHTCHNDGSRDNNRLCNLRYDTPAGNNKDKERHGTHLKGNLTLNDVLMIEDWYDEGMMQKEIASVLGCEQTFISQILRGMQYRHCRL